MADNLEIFKGKSISDLYKEIYTNSKNTKTQVRSLIGQLEELVTSPGEATMMVPLIKDYLDVGVKNNEHLIKLAHAIQKFESLKAQGKEDDFDIGDIQALVDEQKSNDDKLNNGK